jgi:hypothetical protein
MGTYIPLTVFEDAGQATEAKSVLFVTWGGLLGNGSEMEQRFLSFSLPKETGNRLYAQKHWQSLCSSFDVLYSGRDPETGDPLVPLDNDEHWKCIPLFGKVDLEAAVNSWGLVSYNSPGELCQVCHANRSDKLYTDMSLDAPWRETMVTSNDEYMSRLTEPRHPITEQHWFTRFFVRKDQMHVFDCKGVTACVLGSVLRMMVVQVSALGDKQETRMLRVNTLLREYYAREKEASRLPNLKLKNLTIAAPTSSYSYLSGPDIKAANSRNAVPFVAELCETYLRPQESQLHKHALRLVKATSETQHAADGGDDTSVGGMGLNGSGRRS